MELHKIISDQCVAAYLYAWGNLVMAARAYASTNELKVPTNRARGCLEDCASAVWQAELARQVFGLAVELCPSRAMTVDESRLLNCAWQYGRFLDRAGHAINRMDWRFGEVLERKSSALQVAALSFRFSTANGSR